MNNTIKYLIVLTIAITGFNVQAYPGPGWRPLLSCAEMINFYKASMPEGTDLVWVREDIHELKTLYSHSTLRTEIRYCTGDKDLAGSKCISGNVINAYQAMLLKRPNRHKLFLKTLLIQTKKLKVSWL